MQDKLVWAYAFLARYDAEACAALGLDRADGDTPAAGGPGKAESLPP